MNVQIRVFSFSVTATLVLLMFMVSAASAEPRSNKKGVKKPRGVEVSWDLAWSLESCARKRKDCVPSSRYREARPADKKGAGWRIAQRTARFIRSKKSKSVNFVPFQAKSTRYLAYFPPVGASGRAANIVGKKGFAVFVRKVQPEVAFEGTTAKSKRAMRSKKSKPRGVTIYWKWAWTLESCERRGRPQCVPSERYRSVTPGDKSHASWRKAVLTARHLLAGRPDIGDFIPFRADDTRYVAYISPHTATDIDIDGDGDLERVPLDEPVTGVTVYIRKVQPHRR